MVYHAEKIKAGSQRIALARGGLDERIHARGQRLLSAMTHRINLRAARLRPSSVVTDYPIIHAARRKVLPSKRAAGCDANGAARRCAKDDVPLVAKAGVRRVAGYAVRCVAKDAVRGGAILDRLAQRPAGHCSATG